MRTRWARLGTVVVVAVLVLGTGCASAERAGRDGGGDGGAAIGIPRAQADTEATEQAEPEPAPEPRGLGGLAGEQALLPRRGRGLHHARQRRPGHAGGPEGVDHRGRLGGGGVPDRVLRGWHRGLRLGVRLPAGSAAVGAALLVVRAAHGRRALAARPDRRHLDVGARLLRLPAAHRHRVGDPGPVRRDLRVGRGHGRAGRARSPPGRPTTQWGGYSLYAGANGDAPSHAVSFDRPYNGATGANDYRTAAIPVVVRAESTGVPLSYFTNVDLHTTPERARGCPRLRLDGARRVLDQHDARRVLGARDAGHQPGLPGREHHVLAGPAGAAAPRGRPGWSSATGTPRASTRCAQAPGRGDGDVPRAARAPPRARPRSGCSTSATPSTPTTSSPSRAGGGSAARASAAATTSPAWSVREADRVYPDGTLPRPLQVLSHSPYSCRGVTTTAQSVYYTARSGAGVFTAGTLRWGCALVDRCERPLGAVTQEFARSVTGNLVTEFARAPSAHAPGPGQRRGLRPLHGQHGPGELRQVRLRRS